jgi:hypothetical protein
MSHAGKPTAIYGSLVAFFVIAVTKFIAAGSTGGLAMLSEGIHSPVDSGIAFPWPARDHDVALSSTASATSRGAAALGALANGNVGRGSLAWSSRRRTTAIQANERSTMYAGKLKPRHSARTLLVAGAIGLASSGISAEDMTVMLSGEQEVPPVETMASGKGQFTLGDDMLLSGSIKTSNVKATAAHIHAGAAGENGPVAIPLTKKGDAEWIVPAGTRLTTEQVKQLKAGSMYVNVHSSAHKGGEIRAQLN